MLFTCVLFGIAVTIGVKAARDVVVLDRKLFMRRWVIAVLALTASAAFALYAASAGVWEV